MATYLVEIRTGGDLKSELRGIINRIASKFNARKLVRSHYVPHVTLFGTFDTNQEKKVLARIRDICTDYDAIPYTVTGFDHFDKKTIYADVHTSRKLRELRYRLSQELRPVTHGWKNYDEEKWFKFHSTVARDVREPQFSDIWKYVQSEENIHHEKYVKRVTLIRNSRIVKEYSVPQGRFLSSNTATSKPAWMRDGELLERWAQPDDHGGLVPSQPGRIQRFCTNNTGAKHNERRYQQFDGREPKTFIIGDLHLNHGNIIEYCDRPFDSYAEMNQHLVSNWNDTIAPQDTVVFLGDLALYYGTITTHDWLHALNGEIIFIRGNHDGAESIDYEESYILETENREYYCTHRPSDIPDDWGGWAIHGHKHNNDPANYPLFNREEERINASAEMLDYIPISVEDMEDPLEYPQTKPI